MPPKINFLSRIFILLLLNVCYQNSFSNGSSATIRIYIEGTTCNDTISLVYYKNILGHSSTKYLSSVELRSTPDGNGIYYFKINDIARPGYFSVSWDRDSVFGNSICALNMYLIESGDNVKIDFVKNQDGSGIYASKQWFDSDLAGIYKYNNYRIDFSGFGSEKYVCRFESDFFCSMDTGQAVIMDDALNYIVGNHFEKSLDNCLATLEKFKGKMSRLSYEILKADFIGKFGYGTAVQFYSFFKKHAKSKERGKVGYSALESVLKRICVSNLFISEDARNISKAYPSFELLKNVLKFHIEIPALESNVYQNLKRNYDGEFRDRLITIYLLEHYKRMDRGQEYLTDAIETVQSSYCLDQLIELDNAQSIGQLAYNFSLPDTSGKYITLSDFRGKVVLIDFWYKNCGACKDYFQNHLSKVQNAFANNPSVIFIAISIDRNKSEWANAILSGMHSSPYAINLYTEGVGAQHAVIKHYKVMGYPRPLLVDKQGKIYNASEKDLRHKEKLIQNILLALKGV